MQKPGFDLVKNIEVYLEGYKVPFTSIQISEAEGTIPSAAIAFNSNPYVLKLLPTTVVQIFGEVLDPFTRKYESMMLFEGEMTGVDYSKISQGSTFTIKASSMLASLFKARLRPADSVVTRQQSNLERIEKADVIIKSAKVYGGESNVYPSGATTRERLLSQIQTQQAGEYIEGKLNEIGSITQLAGLSEELARVLHPSSGSAASEGDFIPLIQTFNKFFETSDLYYGIQSLSFQLGNSLLALPNPGLTRAFQLKMGFEAFNKMLSGVKRSSVGTSVEYNLMQILQELKRAIKYEMIAPAAPIGAQMFYQSIEEGERKPVRAVYMPKFETGPPALPNVFFPEQVTDTRYSRDMASELTRLISHLTYNFISQTTFPSWSMPMYAVPDVNARKQDGVITSNFTDEETYRGITVKHDQFDGVFTSVAFEDKVRKDTVKGKKSVTGPITKNDMNGSTGEAMRMFAIESYLNQKFGTRVTQISTTWNPYRMIGLPGIAIDPGAPSLTGVVTSINTQISADGVAKSQVTMRNCRVIFDEEPSLASPDLEEVADVDLKKYLIEPLTQEGVTAANELLYNEDLYGFKNIGQDVYTYLLEGNSSRGGKFKSYQNNIWSDYTKNLADSKFTYSQYSDYSILRYLKTLVNEEITWDENFTVNTSLPVELQYSSYLYEAVKRLKFEYKKVLGNSKDSNTVDPTKLSPVHQYINRLSWRRLIRKEEYLKFIGASNSQINHFIDSKDLIAIFNGDYNLSSLRGDVEISRNASTTGSSYSHRALKLKFNALHKLEKLKEGLEKNLKEAGGSAEDWAKQQLSQELNLGTSSTLVITKKENNILFDVYSPTDSASASGPGINPNLTVLNTGYYTRKISEWQKLTKRLKTGISEAEDEIETLTGEIKELQEQINTTVGKEADAVGSTEQMDTMKNVAVSLFKPYNINRRAHVVTAFKNSMNQPTNNAGTNTVLISGEEDNGNN